MSTLERHETAPEDRVPWKLLIAFGMGGLIPIALFNIAQQLISLLGNISLGIGALWLGTIMIVPRLWEAFSDPVIGHLSDNTRTRFGRRRPFIFIGGITVALAFVALWWLPTGPWIRQIFPSDSAYNAFQLVYLLVGTLLFYTACNTFEIPHGALGMEMSSDPHERTRLFSAKSFLGNLFAMATPWLLALASLEFFRGAGGTLNDGMRYVAILIAAVLIPMSYWWFLVLKEPDFIVAKDQHKSRFWDDMRATITNSTFLSLVVIIFTLAMGFNFVNNFANYITIFYLYHGDAVSATGLMGWAGTVWAVTALVAVFPLNWLGKRLGKSHTLLISILLMCAAQLSKIFCYNPTWPYLILIPTALLSAGMLMFFTLGSSMVGDVCDEDELRTGTRNEGTYYSVYWWFIKMGTAFASFVMGALLVYTSFDEQQTKQVDTLHKNLAVIRAEADRWIDAEPAADQRAEFLDKELEITAADGEKLKVHFAERAAECPDLAQQIEPLIKRAESVELLLQSLRTKSAQLPPAELIKEVDKVVDEAYPLKQQAPETLFRLRVVEIGLPLLMSIVSIVLTLRYPLTEARCYEIAELLKARRAAEAP